MMKEFNSTGTCVPYKHYMVDLSSRVAQMRSMVEKGDYYCINRPRQFGKTTILAALKDELHDDYLVTSIDFQAFSYASFATEVAFVRTFCRNMLHVRGKAPADAATRMEEIVADRNGTWTMDDLLACIAEWCEESPLPCVLIIDEVDSATNNQVFLDFLAQLRFQYLSREEDPLFPAFRSVILAGVTDVVHLKAKIRPEDQTKVNSPWNIAADFDVDMSFSVDDIKGMLKEYETDYATGMDIDAVATHIHQWTSGYPFLVSRISQLVHERALGWNVIGVDAAVRLMLNDSRGSLFLSLMGKLEAYPRMRETLRDMLMRGTDLPYAPFDDAQQQLMMYGFASHEDGKLVVANRVFETLLYDRFLLEESRGSMSDTASLVRSQYVQDGHLNMRMLLEGFRRAYVQIFGPPKENERFCEDGGRKQFLIFLKAVINGAGNFYIEAQTRDRTCTDVVVDYRAEQFVVELKIWRGPAFNRNGEGQLVGYLEHFDLSVGYMLSFNFNKRKSPGLKRVHVGDKVVWEETV